MAHSPRRILAVVDDLFFIVKIHDAAKRAGMLVEFLKSEQDMLDKALAEPPALVIVDFQAEARCGAQARQRHRLRFPRSGRAENAGPGRRRRHGAGAFGIFHQPAADSAAARGIIRSVFK